MIENNHDNLLERSFFSVSWNIASTSVFIVVGFLRTWLLARWLPVDVFGIYGLTLAIVGMTGIFADFGMWGAFLNRTAETENEENAARTHFTLQLIFTSVWLILLIAIATTVFTGDKQIALIVIAITSAGARMTQTASLILVRRVIHRRLAFIRAVNVLVTTSAAFLMVSFGAKLWALLSIHIVSLFIVIFLYYIWKPVWRPRLRWSGKEVRYFLNFGIQNLIAGGLQKVLDTIDDLWTGYYLGDVSLGLYNRAYSFATYPRKIVAAPINSVADGTYAELKFERKRLSQAFFRTNSLLIRAGFVFSGVLVLIAPEFIRIFLGEKWMPMLNTFRLMLVFTLLDPMKITVSNLMVGLGYPKRVIVARLVQLVVLIAGLYYFGGAFGIDGVALAADLMIFVGMGILFFQAKKIVDFSLKQMFLVPVAALGFGMVFARMAIVIPAIAGNDWRTLVVKSFIYLVIYIAILFSFERESLARFGLSIKRMLLNRKRD